jgi:hypothetical protein
VKSHLDTGTGAVYANIHFDKKFWIILKMTGTAGMIRISGTRRDCRIVEKNEKNAG